MDETQLFMPICPWVLYVAPTSPALPQVGCCYSAWTSVARRSRYRALHHGVCPCTPICKTVPRVTTCTCSGMQPQQRRLLPPHSGTGTCGSAGGGPGPSSHPGARGPASAGPRAYFTIAVPNRQQPSALRPVSLPHAAVRRLRALPERDFNPSRHL